MSNWAVWYLKDDEGDFYLEAVNCDPLYSLDNCGEWNDDTGWFERVIPFPRLGRQEIEDALDEWWELVGRDRHVKDWEDAK